MYSKMKKIILNALLLASVTMFSCGDDDEQVCLDCVHSGGSTMEMCGTESDMDDVEAEWTTEGGTCTRK